MSLLKHLTFQNVSGINNQILHLFRKYILIIIKNIND